MASDDEATDKKREAEGEDGGGGEAKKAKTEAQKNSDGETFFLLSAKRRLTVRNYKNTTYVDIREFYGDDNDKPGKKGISMTVDQFKKLKELVAGGEIDDAIEDLADK